MTFDRPEKLRCRRGLVFRDRRGLPAKRVSLERAARQFGQMLHWARRNGICVVTDAGKPAFFLIRVENAALIRWIYATIAVATARQRNPGGIFTLADEIFDSPSKTDQWLVSRLRNSADEKPGDILTRDEVNEIQILLRKIQHGFVA